MNKNMSDYENLDGLRVEIDTELKVATIILDRPPYNVGSMLQREHLSSIFNYCVGYVMNKPLLPIIGCY